MQLSGTTKTRKVRAFLDEDIARRVVVVLMATQIKGQKLVGSYDAQIDQAIHAIQEGIDAPPRAARKNGTSDESVSETEAETASV